MLLLNRKGERGASLPMVLVLIVLFAGVVTPLSFHIHKISRSRNLLNQMQLEAKAEARIRSLLTSSDPSCPLSVAFRKYRDFSADAPVIDIPMSKVSPCLFSEAEEKLFKAVFKDARIKVFQTSRERHTLSRSIELRMTFEAKGKASEGIVGRSVSSIKNYRLRVLAPTNFGLVFLGGAKPLVQTQGNVSVQFKGHAFYAGSDALAVSQIADLTDPRVVFAKTLFVRAPNLAASKNEVVDASRLTKVFPGGIETNSLNASLLAAHLPDASDLWNFRVDQSFLQGSSYAVAVPELSSGNPSAASCHDPSLRFAANRANYTSIPGGASGIASLARTCKYDTTQIPLFFHSRPKANLTITMAPGDNVLCGIVAAGTLTIQLPQAGAYAFFGNVYVNRIVLKGPNGGSAASFYMYNPEDNLVPEVPLPAGQNMRGLLEEFKSLGSSLAWNYELPIVADSPFPLRRPDEILAPCGGGAGVKSYRTEYKPIHEEPAFGDIVRNAGDKALVILEDVL